MQILPVILILFFSPSICLGKIYLCEKIKENTKKYQDEPCNKEDAQTKIIFFHMLDDREYLEYDFIQHRHMPKQLDDGTAKPKPTLKKKKPVKKKAKKKTKKKIKGKLLTPKK